MTEKEKNALKNNASLSDQELIENATNIEKFSNDVALTQTLRNKAN
jgi:hypothetical protein